MLDSVRSLEESDGGWKLAALDKQERVDHSPAPAESDGYATALVVLAIEESGSNRQDQALQRGLTWLETHQQKDGHWTARSMNKQRDANSPRRSSWTMPPPGSPRWRSRRRLRRCEGLQWVMKKWLF